MDMPIAWIFEQVNACYNNFIEKNPGSEPTHVVIHWDVFYRLQAYNYIHVDYLRKMETLNGAKVIKSEDISAHEFMFFEDSNKLK